jgi:hypothetical protein
LAKDSLVTVTRGNDVGTGGVLAWSFQLDSLALVMKVIQDLIQFPIQPPGAPGNCQGRGQQSSWDAGYFQPEPELQRRQAAHRAGGDGQNCLKEGRLCSDENAITC